MILPIVIAAPEAIRRLQQLLSLSWFQGLGAAAVVARDFHTSSELMSQ
ncbi:MAG: hypothetical protein MR419_04795 [Clostridiales bacterium]|nr:hypothetical protein [Clostridiales bacterium]MDY4171396.1 hypothetical protein [Evtepia sp.]